MENLDTPNDHLFRGGPPKMNVWNDFPPMVKSDHTYKDQDYFKFPQVRSFYYKREGSDYSIDPFEHHFYNRGFSSHQSMPYRNTNMQEMNAYSEDESESPKMNMYAGEEPNSKMNSYVSEEPNSRKMNKMSEPATNSEMSGGGEQRVVGGRDVSDGEIPWQVRFMSVFFISNIYFLNACMFIGKYFF